MKILVTIFIGLMVVGCGKKQPTNTNESSTPTITAKKKAEKETPSKGDDKNSTAANQEPPTADELLDSMGTPLNELEKIIVGKYLEKVTNTTDPNFYKGWVPSETINRVNRTYSILYNRNEEKTLVHGIWMIKGNTFYYMELVSDGVQIPKEKRNVYKATVITLDKKKSLFSAPSFDENLKEDRITWESIKKFTAIEMQKFNDEETNKNFNIFKNNTKDSKKNKITPSLHSPTRSSQVTHQSR